MRLRSVGNTAFIYAPTATASITQPVLNAQQTERHQTSVNDASASA